MPQDLTTQYEAEILEECQEALGYRFRQPDLEPALRDAVVLALPLAPLCTDDCPGLCVECGGRRADLAPDHGHETLDPRWAALRGRASAG